MPVTRPKSTVSTVIDMSGDRRLQVTNTESIQYPPAECNLLEVMGRIDEDFAGTRIHNPKTGLWYPSQQLDIDSEEMTITFTGNGLPSPGAKSKEEPLSGKKDRRVSLAKHQRIVEGLNKSVDIHRRKLGRAESEIASLKMRLEKEQETCRGILKVSQTMEEAKKASDTAFDDLATAANYHVETIKELTAKVIRLQSTIVELSCMLTEARTAE